MKASFLGRTGLRVSALCFGTMSFGNEADAATSEALYHRAREAGVNVFDTADVYNGGESERILGRLIGPCRDEVVLASKVYFPTSSDANARGLSRYHIVRAVEASLKRLGTDRIDIYYLHRFDEDTGVEETWRAVDDLVRAGKILYPAVSNFSAWQAMRATALTEARGWARPACFQPMYSLAKRQAEVEILPMCLAEGIGVMPYGPTAAGLLTGKYGVDTRPEVGRIVSNKMYSVRYEDARHYQLADSFSALARERGYHPAALAIAWVAAHPAVTAPIIGMRSMEHLDVALSSLDIDMPWGSELYRDIAALSEAPAPATDRNEESSAHNFGKR